MSIFEDLAAPGEPHYELEDDSIRVQVADTTFAISFDDANVMDGRDRWWWRDADDWGKRRYISEWSEQFCDLVEGADDEDLTDKIEAQLDELVGIAYGGAVDVIRKCNTANPFDLWPARVDAAEQLAGLDPDVWAMNGGVFTCGEADAVGDFLAAWASEDLAHSFINAHAEHEGEDHGDRHYAWTRCQHCYRLIRFRETEDMRVGWFHVDRSGQPIDSPDCSQPGPFDYHLATPEVLEQALEAAAACHRHWLEGGASPSTLDIVRAAREAAGDRDDLDRLDEITVEVAEKASQGEYPDLVTQVRDILDYK